MSFDGDFGPLRNIRVLEFGQLLAGPIVGHFLADFGAEVIKAEAPGLPDTMRRWGETTEEGRGLWWSILSRNKKCITLNLREEKGQDLLKQLVETTDVLVENFRPGTMEKWGVGYDVLSDVNPGLIMTRVTGFGQTGPYSDRVGFASVGEAMGGLRYLNGYPDDDVPPRAGISLGDDLAGMFATQGILMALYWRDVNGGRGQVVDSSIMESCFQLMEDAVPAYDKLDKIKQPSGSGVPAAVPSDAYTTGDGKLIIIAANADRIFARLCEAMGRPELSEDPRFATTDARANHREQIDQIIEDWADQYSRDELEEILNEYSVVNGPIYNIADIFEDPHYEARNMIIEMEDPALGDIKHPNVYPLLSRTPGEARRTGPPELGYDNEEIYGELLGLSKQEMQQLRDEGII